MIKSALFQVFSQCKDARTCEAGECTGLSKIILAALFCSNLHIIHETDIALVSSNYVSLTKDEENKTVVNVVKKKSRCELKGNRCFIQRNS